MSRLRPRPGHSACCTCQPWPWFDHLGDALGAASAVRVAACSGHVCVWVRPHTPRGWLVDVLPYWLPPFGADAWSCYRLARLGAEIDAGEDEA